MHGFGYLVHQFFADDKLKIALVVVFLDFVAGVLAAFKLGTFRLSYVYDFARNDLLFKLVPWFFLYTGAFYAGHQNIVIPGIDMGVVAGTAYAAMIAAWIGSILASLAQLGIQTTGAGGAARRPDVRLPQIAGRAGVRLRRLARRRGA
jgi:hypothetical protein